VSSVDFIVAKSIITTNTKTVYENEWGGGKYRAAEVQMMILTFEDIPVL